ncbi:hypothetical protein HNO53_13000 [Billgrantia antri]|uniref:Uncharacterized protein n=1 Tax=Halomonas sulfidivorans TaxID=2733488 RepID=A0ABX7WGR2_9GAMM|nr:hypothetical protein [Halomonas sulfidivorans]QTP59553.1 hypothetical protein HNO53_13000 [Halomonas sulfidivorans]
MKIKWVSRAYGTGYWESECGEKAILSGNFKCTYGGMNLLVVMAEQHVSGGHGEGSWKEKYPTYIDAETLKEVRVSGFIEI